jgi:hypothetical protein
LATAHLSEASRELPATVTSLVELKAALTRFSEQTLLILTNDARARAIHRLVLAEVDHSEAAQLFYESGPSESIAALGKLFRVAIEREMLRRGTASIFAKQFMSLVTAEINARVYQRDPAPLGRTAIRSLAKRAVDMFLAGAEPR